MRSRANESNQTPAPTPDSARGNGARSRRRGSALVLVVGTLALIAVVAAFYVTLGQADTRVSRGVERGADLEDIERQVAQYIAKVIADDRLSVMLDTVSSNEQFVGERFRTDGGAASGPTSADRQRFVREATDYPYTDFSKVSIVSDGTGTAPTDSQLAFVPANYRNMPAAYGSSIVDAVERIRFRAAGDDFYKLDLPGELDAGLNIPAGNAAALADMRVGSDPWLSSSEPTFTGLTQASTGLGSHDHRNYSQIAFAQSNAAANQNELFYLDNRDWAQITNLAPDGLSVNLWNLRNNFDAESGLGADATGRPRMSENRTLLTFTNTAVGTVPQYGIRATDRLHLDPLGAFGTPSILGAGNGVASYTDVNSFAIKNTPAWWTMNQRFLYFPADPDFQILGRDVDPTGLEPQNGAFQTVQTPAHPDYPFYQYADADGDGMFDSRWFELKDATLGPNGVTDLLSNETGMRFVIAAKVIDLSGKINVNSATDGLVPPTSRVPAGATPAEIDLRRQLTLEDASERYAPVFSNPNAGIGNQRLSYSHIDRLPFADTQTQAGGFVAADYERYATGITPGFVLPNNITPLTGDGVRTGRYAYDAIRRAIQGDELGLPAEATSLRLPNIGGANLPLYESSPFEFYSFDPTENPATRADRVGLGQAQLTNAIPEDLARLAVNRRDYYYNIGGSNITDPADAPFTGQGFGGNLFGLEDLAELLTFHGANDDRVQSRLERTTSGRFDEGAGPNDSTISFDPLRSNRPTALETRNHDNRLNTVNPGNGNAGVGSDNLIDHETMALLALNPRLRLTTVSGAAPLRSRVVRDLNGDGILSAAERRLTDEDARLDLTGNPSPQALFNLYADALIPYSFVDATWAQDPEGQFVSGATGTYTAVEYNQFRTLAYGYRGSELGLRLSAHLAVNMADILDSDDTPTAATVLAAPRDASSDTIRQNLGTAWTTGFPGGIENSPYTWWEAGNRFDLGDDRLAPDEQELASPLAALDQSRKAYSVYGVEPQPFVTEVAVVSVYSDVPRARLSTTGVSNGFEVDPRLTGSGGGTNQLTEDEAVSASYNGPYTTADPEGRSADYLANGGQLLSNGCDPTDFGWDDGPPDDVSLRFDTSGDNPDLMLHLLAVQVTNPFDVPINLTDNEPAYAQDPTNANRQIPNESFIGPLTGGADVEGAKFYIEYNGHFFPLVEYIEDIQYRSLINPFVNQSGQPGLYRIVLEPGESRVVYVSAHPSLRNLTQRWKQIEEVYRNQVGDDSTVDVSPDFLATPSTTAYVQNFIDDQFAVRPDSTSVDPLLNNDEVVYPSRLVPFQPDSGNMLPQGNAGNPFVEFMRTNLRYRQPQGLAGTDADEFVDRMRQEVRLWRRMTAGNGDGTGTIQEREDYTGNTTDNYIGNDLLADRLRDPQLSGSTTASPDATLDYGTLDWDRIRTRDFIANPQNSYDPFVNGGDASFWTNTVPPAQNNVYIPLTMATDDGDGSWSFYGSTNQGLTICTRAGFRRPDNLTDPEEDGLLNEDFETPRGVLPAWCIEGIEQNHNIPTPSTDTAIGPDGPQYIPQVIDQSLNNEYMGELFGFRGCHGRQDMPEPRSGVRGGVFYMNFLRFVKDTKVLRDANGRYRPGMNMVRAEGFGDSAMDNTDQAIGSPPSIQTMDDPMLVPTITRHPSLKFVRDTLVNIPADRDGDGMIDDVVDDIGFDNAIQTRSRPSFPNIRDATKRTIARFGAVPAAGEDVFADDPAIISLGRDGLGDAADPRDNLVRVGDLALPFGVGATFAPRFTTIEAANFRANDWVTLSEALSAAMGYETPAFYNRDPGATDGPWTLLNELVDAKGVRNAPVAADTLAEGTRPYEQFFVLDSARLDLNAFTPFVNRIDLVGVTAPPLLNVLPEFNPLGTPGIGNLAISDYRVGLSEPPAQRLFSMATAINRAGGDPLTTPTIGTVNLNTASEAVLRSVPGFTPSVQFSQAGIEYDQFGPTAPDPEPNDDPMADNILSRVAGRTISNAAPPQPPAGIAYTPPMGVVGQFGGWMSNTIPGTTQTSTTFVSDGWRANADVSASLAAFRDRTQAGFRSAAKDNAGGGAPGGPFGAQQPRIPLETAFDFSPTTALSPVFSPGIAPRAPIFAQTILDLAVNNYATDFSRGAFNGQIASSERPGLSGTGSLLSLTTARSDPLASTRIGVVNPRFFGNAPVLRWQDYIETSTVQGTTTRHGRDSYEMSAINQDENGVADTNPLTPGDENFLTLIDNNPEDNFSYTLGRAGFVNENPDFENDPMVDDRSLVLGDSRRTLEDQVPDDILEELAVFNGAANTVDVRSDFYAAWFLIRGYAREDVQGLERDEPMRASYEKRFLMVIDRSNVTDAGQLPRVLFIREVPL